MSPLAEHNRAALAVIARFVEGLRDDRDLEPDVAEDSGALARSILDTREPEDALTTVAIAGAFLVNDLCRELGTDPVAYMRAVLVEVQTEDER